MNSQEIFHKLANQKVVLGQKTHKAFINDLSTINKATSSNL